MKLLVQFFQYRLITKPYDSFGARGVDRNHSTHSSLLVASFINILPKWCSAMFRFDDEMALILDSLHTKKIRLNIFCLETAKLVPKEKSNQVQKEPWIVSFSIDWCQILNLEILKHLCSNFELPMTPKFCTWEQFFLISPNRILIRVYYQKVPPLVYTK